MFKSNKIKSLSRQLSEAALIITFFGGMIFLITHYTLVEINKKTEIDRINYFLETLYYQHKEIIANEIFSGQTKSLKMTLDNYTANLYIVSATVFYNDGKVFVSSGTDLKNDLLSINMDSLDNGSRFDLKDVEGMNLIIYSTSIIVAGEKFGYFRIIYDISDIISHRNIENLIFLTILIIWLFILMFVLDYRLRSVIIKPVLILKDSMVRVGKSDFSDERTVFESTEMYEIGNAFEEMKNRLKSGKEYLEDAVKERTAELKSTNDELVIKNNQLRTYQDILSASEEKYRLLTEYASDVIWVLNLSENKFAYISPSIFQLRGLTVDEAMSEKLEDAMTPDSLKLIIEAIKINSAEFVGDPENPKYYINEIQQPHKNGSLVWIEVSTKYRYNFNGEIEIVGVSRNINDRKQIENDLIEAKKQAEKSTRIKSEFLANMSHEIRTPMNAIMGFSNLAMKTNLNDKQGDYIRKISASAQTLLGIINDILDFSKIEAGKMEFENVSFNLEELIYNVQNLLPVKPADKGLDFIVDLSPEIPRILLGDPLRLSQILTNLINNSIKFTETGYILLKVELLSKNYETKLKFSVKDTGIGISEEKRNLLFIPFSQADTSVTRKFGGTGLGLAISKNLVELMSGEISVESDIYKGSEFSFTAVFGFTPEYTQNNFVFPEELCRLKILIVDNNKISSGIISNLLKSFGCRADCEYSGIGAVQKIVENHNDYQYDLLFIDYDLPEINGIDIAVKIRDTVDLKNRIDIILMDDAGNDDIIDNQLIAAVIKKPVMPAELFNTVLKVYGYKKAEILINDVKINATQNNTIGLSGVKVLLVEDNLMNQQIAREILENADIKVYLAGNGQQALDMLANESFDIVLMDIQMPVMSGYEATRLIRKIEKFKDLPIIAMTAHAMSGAKEQCLSQGMNDYISKPIDSDNLYGILLKWINRDHRDNNHRDKQINLGNVPQVKPFSDKNINPSIDDFPERLEGFDLSAGLVRLGGNKKLYRELIIAFAGEYSNIAEETAAFITQEKFREADMLIHSIKGASGNLSAMELYEFSKILETAIKDKDFNQLPDMLKKLNLLTNIIKRSAEELM